MKYYKDKYNLPVWNWLMLQSKGFDVKYLLKNVKSVSNKQYIKLNNVFEEIIYSLKHTDNKILLNFLLWKSLLIQLNAKLMTSNSPIVAKLEQTFRDYLTTLELNYENFEVIEYYLNPDYKNKFLKVFSEHLSGKYLEMILENLKKFEDIKFYTWDEFLFFANDYPEMLPFTLHPNFKKEFILSRELKRNSLVDLDTYLVEIYTKYKMYNEYQFVRGQLFDISSLKSESKKEFDPFKELAYISNTLGFQINAKNTSLAEYEGHLDTVKRKIEESKPKEGGHGSH